MRHKYCEIGEYMEHCASTGLHRAFAAYSHDEFIEHYGQEESIGK